MAQSVEALIEATITMQEGKNRVAKISTILNKSIDKKVTDSVNGVKKEVTWNKDQRMSRDHPLMMNRQEEEGTFQRQSS